MKGQEDDATRVVQEVNEVVDLLIQAGSGRVGRNVDGIEII